MNELHAPILTVHWEGRIDGRLLNDYFRWKLRRLGSETTWGEVVLIHDLTRVARPNPSIRKVAQELIAEAREHTSRRVLRNIAVVNNPVIAGVLRALDWTCGRNLAETVRSLPEALELAHLALVEEGRQPPSLHPESYFMPSRAPTARN